MKKIILSDAEANDLVERIGAKLGYDYNRGLSRPKNRKDVAVVVWGTENGSTYGYDTVYVVWKESNGSIHHQEIKNSRSTKDYIHVESVEVKKDGGIQVKFGSGGSYSGTPWSESMRLAISSDKAVVSRKTPISYAEKVSLLMTEIVESHQHNHPLYKPTIIKEKVIDSKKKIATFILFEQIDSDRNTTEGEGWLGDQFRYSLWVIKNTDKPAQIFEDHAYIRPHSKNQLTGTRGRDCSLTNLRLNGKKITVSHPEGENFEKQKVKDLSFMI